MDAMIPALNISRPAAARGLAFKLFDLLM